MKVIRRVPLNAPLIAAIFLNAVLLGIALDKIYFENWWALLFLLPAALAFNTAINTLEKNGHVITEYVARLALNGFILTFVATFMALFA